MKIRFPFPKKANPPKAESRTRDFPGIGPVLIVRSARAQRVNISIKPDGTVRLAVPPGISFKQAEGLLSVKKDWITQHLLKYNKTLAEANPAPIRAIPIAEAKPILINCLLELSRRHNLPCNTIKVKLMTSRWGSCSVRNNINLNARVAGLPPHLMDYVLLHELVHTRVKNHGPGFWKLLETTLGEDPRKLARELRKYGFWDLK